jgi:type I restriction enzyme, S subunit
MDIPTIKVSELAEQIRGVSYGKQDASPIPQFGHLPVLRANNITENGLNYSDLVYVPSQRISIKQKIRQYDVIIAASSGSIDVVGKAAPSLTDFDGAFGAFCKVLRPNSKVHPTYFAHFFKTPFYRRSVSALAEGANINNLRNEHLDNFEIPLPPIAEQKRIAAILDQAEELRSQRRKAIGLLDELVRSVFLEMFGDPVTNPKGWETIHFHESFSVPLRNGISPSNSGKVTAKVLTLSAITGRSFNEDAFKITTFQAEIVSHQTVDDKDFLICRGNGNLNLVGKGYFPLRKMPDIAFPDTIIAAQINSKYFARNFLQHLWNSEAVRLQIESLARTTNGTLKVNQTMLEGISLLIPPIPLQQEFAQRVAAIEALKETHRQSLAKLDELFNSLQHRAFRGEL